MLTLCFFLPVLLLLPPMLPFILLRAIFFLLLQALEMFEDAEKFFRRLPGSFYGECIACVWQRTCLFVRKQIVFHFLVQIQPLPGRGDHA